MCAKCLGQIGPPATVGGIRPGVESVPDVKGGPLWRPSQHSSTFNGCFASTSLHRRRCATSVRVQCSMASMSLSQRK